MCAEGAWAFVISDIRVEGIQRTEPGIVFSHLPFRVGDDYTPEKGTRAIRMLYRSGLFKDVNLTQDGSTVVVSLVERPAVATITTHGIKVFDKAAVEKSLRDVGFSAYSWRGSRCTGRRTSSRRHSRRLRETASPLWNGAAAR